MEKKTNLDNIGSRPVDGQDIVDISDDSKESNSIYGKRNKSRKPLISALGDGQSGACSKLVQNWTKLGILVGVKHLVGELIAKTTKFYEIDTRHKRLF